MWVISAEDGVMCINPARAKWASTEFGVLLDKNWCKFACDAWMTDPKQDYCCEAEFTGDIYVECRLF